MSAWPQLSKPIYAGDNFLMAVAQSQQTVGRPPARPTGGTFFVTRRDALTNQDCSPFDDDEMVAHYADRRGY